MQQERKFDKVSDVRPQYLRQLAACHLDARWILPEVVEVMTCRDSESATFLYKLMAEYSVRRSVFNAQRSTSTRKFEGSGDSDSEGQ